MEYSDKKFFKITNIKENHHGFQYHDGLNILNEPFSTEGSCVPGGFYFSDVQNILKFLYFGNNLREIELPYNDPDFKIYHDKDKWRTNKIILGKKFKLDDIKTFEYLVQHGADIHVADGSPIAWACEQGYLDIVQYLVSLGANIHGSSWNRPIVCAVMNNHLDIIKYLISLGVDINIGGLNNELLLMACRYGYLEICQYLVSVGINIHDGNEYALVTAASNGNVDVVKYLVECGSNIHANDGGAIVWAYQNGHLDVVKYLLSVGADIHSKHRCNVIHASPYVRFGIEATKYLISFAHKLDILDYFI